MRTLTASLRAAAAAACLLLGLASMDPVRAEPPPDVLYSSKGDAEVFEAYRARFSAAELSRIVEGARLLTGTGGSALRALMDRARSAEGLKPGDLALSGMRAFAEGMGLSMEDLELLNAGRNLHQIVQYSTIPRLQDVIGQPGWRRLPAPKAAFHAVGYDDEDIAKYVHDNGCEYVFRREGAGWAFLNDGVNTGTFNYLPDGDAFGHAVLDILPWIRWGVGEEERLRVMDRLFLSAASTPAGLVGASPFPDPAVDPAVLPRPAVSACPGIAAMDAPPPARNVLSPPEEEPRADLNAAFVTALGAYNAAITLPPEDRGPALANVAAALARIVADHPGSRLAGLIEARAVPGVDFGLLPEPGRSTSPLAGPLPDMTTANSTAAVADGMGPRSPSALIAAPAPGVDPAVGSAMMTDGGVEDGVRWTLAKVPDIDWPPGTAEAALNFAENGAVSFGNLTVLPPVPNGAEVRMHLYWAPGGRHVLAVQADPAFGGLRAAVVDSDAGRVTSSLIPENAVSGRAPAGDVRFVRGPVAWSPDGRWIGIRVFRGEWQADLYLVDVHDGATIVVTPEDLGSGRWAGPVMASLRSSGSDWVEVDYEVLSCADAACERPVAARGGTMSQRLPVAVTSPPTERHSAPLDPAPVSTQSAQTQNHTAPLGYRWVQLASRATAVEARAFAAGVGDDARIFRTRNGWYAITGALLFETESLQDVVAERAWPADSLLTRGESFAQELALDPAEASPTPAFVHTHTLRATDVVWLGRVDGVQTIVDSRPLDAGADVTIWGRPDEWGYCLGGGGEGAVVRCADLQAFVGGADPFRSKSAAATGMPPGVAEWGPGIVGGGELGYAPCGDRRDIALCLRELGLSEEAIRFTVTVGDESAGSFFADAFHELGAVDLADATFEGASPHPIPVLLNGTLGAELIVGSAFQLGAVFTDTASRSLLRRHPEATPRSTRILGHRLLADETQRFVLVEALVDGCQACAFVGSAVTFLDVGPATGGRVVRRPVGLAGEAAEEGFDGLIREGRTGWESVPYATKPLTLQYRLNALGYDAGPMDGAPGPQTRAALTSFQVEHCVAPTGQVDAATARALGAADGFAAPCGGTGELDGTVAVSQAVDTGPIKLERDDPVRAAILDVVRPAAERSYGAPVEFWDASVRVAGSIAHMAGTAKRPGGVPIDIVATPGFLHGEFQPDSEQNRVFEALLVKGDSGAWMIDRTIAGPTEAYWLDDCATWGPLFPETCGAIASKAPSSGALAAPPGSRWLQTHSRADRAEAVALARGMRARMPEVRVFRASNGWYAVVARAVQDAEAEQLARIVRDGALPSDAFLVGGESYVEAVPIASPDAAVVAAEAPDAWPLTRTFDGFGNQGIAFRMTVSAIRVAGGIRVRLDAVEGRQVSGASFNPVEDDAAFGLAFFVSARKACEDCRASFTRATAPGISLTPGGLVYDTPGLEVLVPNETLAEADEIGISLAGNGLLFLSPDASFQVAEVEGGADASVGPSMAEGTKRGVGVPSGDAEALGDLVGPELTARTVTVGGCALASRFATSSFDWSGTCVNGRVAGDGTLVLLDGERMVERLTVGTGTEFRLRNGELRWLRELDLTFEAGGQLNFSTGRNATAFTTALPRYNYQYRPTIDRIAAAAFADFLETRGFDDEAGRLSRLTGFATQVVSEGMTGDEKHAFVLMGRDGVPLTPPGRYGYRSEALAEFERERAQQNRDADQRERERVAATEAAVRERAATELRAQVTQRVREAEARWSERWGAVIDDGTAAWGNLAELMRYEEGRTIAGLATGQSILVQYEDAEFRDGQAYVVDEQVAADIYGGMPQTPPGWRDWLDGLKGVEAGVAVRVVCAVPAEVLTVVERGRTYEARATLRTIEGNALILDCVIGDAL